MRLVERLADLLFGRPDLSSRNGDAPTPSEDFERRRAAQDERRRRIEAEAELWARRQR